MMKCSWMKIIKNLAVVFGTLFLLLLSGCIGEDMSSCPRENLLYVTVAEADWLSEDYYVDGAIIYVFDKNEKYLYKKEISAEEIINKTPISLTYRPDEQLQAIVWGNYNGKGQISPLVPGSNINELQIIQKREDWEYVSMPDALFYGKKKLSGISDEVIIFPKTGRLVATVRGLPSHNTAQEYKLTADSHYYGYNFAGTPVAHQVRMKLPCKFNEQHYLITYEPYHFIHYPITDTHNEQESVTLNLYKEINGKEELLVSADKDNKGLPIRPKAGETINVLITFDEDGGIDITTVITGWNEVHQWSEW